MQVIHNHEVADRIDMELTQLEEKLVKLDRFLVDEAGKLMSQEQQRLLRDQRLAMMDYADILSERLRLLRGE